MKVLRGKGMPLPFRLKKEKEVFDVAGVTNDTENNNNGNVYLYTIKFKKGLMHSQTWSE